MDDCALLMNDTNLRTTADPAAWAVRAIVWPATLTMLAVDDAVELSNFGVRFAIDTALDTTTDLMIESLFPIDVTDDAATATIFRTPCTIAVVPDAVAFSVLYCNPNTSSDASVAALDELVVIVLRMPRRNDAVAEAVATRICVTRFPMVAVTAVVATTILETCLTSAATDDAVAVTSLLCVAVRFNVAALEAAALVARVASLAVLATALAIAAAVLAIRLLSDEVDDATAVAILETLLTNSAIDDAVATTAWLFVAARAIVVAADAVATSILLCVAIRAIVATIDAATVSVWLFVATRSITAVELTVAICVVDRRFIRAAFTAAAILLTALTVFANAIEDDATAVAAWLYTVPLDGNLNAPTINPCLDEFPAVVCSVPVAPAAVLTAWAKALVVSAPDVVLLSATSPQKSGIGLCGPPVATDWLVGLVAAVNSDALVLSAPKKNDTSNSFASAVVIVPVVTVVLIAARVFALPVSCVIGIYSAR